MATLCQLGGEALRIIRILHFVAGLEFLILRAEDFLQGRQSLASVAVCKAFMASSGDANKRSAMTELVGVASGSAA